MELKQQNGDEDRDDINYRVKLFYTEEGLVKKTFLDIEMEGMTRYDRIIEIYESKHEFVPLVYSIAIEEVIDIKRKMEKYYHKFYDEYKKEGYKTWTPELKQLRSYQHNITKFLEEEIRRRRKHFRECRGKYRSSKKKKAKKNEDNGI